MIKTVHIIEWDEGRPIFGADGLAKDREVALWMYNYVYGNELNPPTLGFVVKRIKLEEDWEEDLYTGQTSKRDRFPILNKYLFLN